MLPGAVWQALAASYFLRNVPDASRTFKCLPKRPLAILSTEICRPKMNKNRWVVTLCCTTTPLSPKCYNNQTLAFSLSQFVSSNPFLSLKNQALFSGLQIKRPRTRNSGFVFAAQFNIFKALQTAWNVGKDGIEAGTSLVPASVPRPIARISVTVVALSVSLFVLKSFVSTVFFVLATMGLAYFIFIALNRGEGPRGNESTTSTPKGDGADDSLEEARRIMEKYK